MTHICEDCHGIMYEQDGILICINCDNTREIEDE